MMDIINHPTYIANIYEKIHSISETLATVVEEREQSQRESLTLVDLDWTRRTFDQARRSNLIDFFFSSDCVHFCLLLDWTRRTYGRVEKCWIKLIPYIPRSRPWRRTRTIGKRGECWTTGWPRPPPSPPTATQSPAPLPPSFALMMVSPMPHVADNKCFTCCLQAHWWPIDEIQTCQYI